MLAQVFTGRPFPSIPPVRAFSNLQTITTSWFLQSTDLNKGIRHILVSSDTSAIGSRSFETILPFLSKDDSRKVTAIRCFENLGRTTAGDVRLEV